MISDTAKEIVFFNVDKGERQISNINIYSLNDVVIYTAKQEYRRDENYHNAYKILVRVLGDSVYIDSHSRYGDHISTVRLPLNQITLHISYKH